MKKFLFYLFLVIIVCFFGTKIVVLAGEDIVHMESNSPPQDSLIIGEISDLDRENRLIRIDVLRIVTGTLCKKEIVLRDIEIKDCNIGSGILLSADFLDNKCYECQVAYGYFKVELQPDTKVKILNDSRESEINMIELEWFVNTGRTTSSSENKIYSLNQNGENELIYDEDKHSWLKNSLDDQYTAPDVMREWKIKALLCIVGVVILICLISWKIIKRKRG